MKLVSQSEYPYKAKTEICHFFSQSHGGVAVKNFTTHDFRWDFIFYQVFYKE